MENIETTNVIEANDGIATFISPVLAEIITEEINGTVSESEEKTEEPETPQPWVMG